MFFARARFNIVGILGGKNETLADMASKGRRNLGRVASVVALGTASLLLASCSPMLERVCPPVGYLSTLNIELIGNTSEVAEVTVCEGADCADEDALHKMMLSGKAVQAEQAGAARSVWTATLDSPEDPLVVRVVDDLGGAIVETKVQPEWERTGGSAECGGPTSADVTQRW